MGAILCPEIDEGVSDLNNIGMYSPTQEIVTGINENDRGSYSSVLDNQSQDLEYVAALHEFVSTLVQESRDLDIDIADALDDYFWELL